MQLVQLKTFKHMQYVVSLVNTTCYTVTDICAAYDLLDLSFFSYNLIFLNFPLTHCQLLLINFLFRRRP